MSTYETVRQAILNKQQVIATYDGHRREMCPHVIGTKDGVERTLVYQFGGTSSSGNIPQWRCMDIDRLSNVSVRSGQWHTSGGHSKPQTCVDVVDVEVSH